MRSLISFSAILALTSTASAEGLTYGYGSYEYSNYGNDSVEADTNQFVGAVEYEINQFLFSADFARRSVSGVGTEISNTYAIGAAFKVTPEILAGAGLIGRGDDVGDDNGFEVFGQYKTDQYGVALNVDKPSEDSDSVRTSVFGTYQATPDLTVGLSVQQDSEDDITAYQLSGGYAQGPFDLRGYYNGFHSSSINFDTGVVGLRGTYEVTPEIRMLAGYQSFVGDDAFDVSTYNIGGGYQVIQTVWIDAFYGQVLYDTADDIDRFGIQLTFETGARQRIDNSFYQNNIDDQTAGFGALIFELPY